jgi:hypothetical protein
MVNFMPFDSPQFWIVWRENTTPSFKHPSYQSAKAEAERLARLHGGTFHVLEHRASAERVDVVVQEVERPF